LQHLYRLNMAYVAVEASDPGAGHRASLDSSASLPRVHDIAQQLPPSGTSETAEEIDKRPKDTAQTKTSTPAKKLEPQLRYRNTPRWLLGIYLVTLIVPWVLICILDTRPLTISSYHDQRGRVDSQAYLSFWSILALVNILRSLSGILTIPVTSTIVAYAAVTYAQKRHAKQKLNATQLFALSDRGWADVTKVWHANSSGRGSPLFWYGVLLVLIGMIRHPSRASSANTNTGCGRKDLCSNPSRLLWSP
jgi:hypothetical protein